MYSGPVLGIHLLTNPNILMPVKYIIYHAVMNKY